MCNHSEASNTTPQCHQVLVPHVVGKLRFLLIHLKVKPHQAGTNNKQTNIWSIFSFSNAANYNRNISLIPKHPEHSFLCINSDRKPHYSVINIIFDQILASMLTLEPTTANVHIALSTSLLFYVHRASVNKEIKNYNEFVLLLLLRGIFKVLIRKTLFLSLPRLFRTQPCEQKQEHCHKKKTLSCNINKS